MDLPVNMSIPHLTEGGGWNEKFLHYPTTVPMEVRDAKVQRRKARLFYVEERQFTAFGADSELQIDIKRTELPKQVVIGQNRLYVYSPPPSLVEGLGDGLGVGIKSSHINIAPGCNVLKRSPQDGVFMVLSERNECHKRVLYL
jgi:hypothetical protein